MHLLKGQNIRSGSLAAAILAPICLFILDSILQAGVSLRARSTRIIGILFLLIILVLGIGSIASMVQIASSINSVIYDGAAGEEAAVDMRSIIYSLQLGIEQSNTKDLHLVDLRIRRQTFTDAFERFQSAAFVREDRDAAATIEKSAKDFFSYLSDISGRTLTGQTIEIERQKAQQTLDAITFALKSDRVRLHTSSGQAQAAARFALRIYKWTCIGVILFMSWFGMTIGTEYWMRKNTEHLERGLNE